MDEDMVGYLEACLDEAGGALKLLAQSLALRV